MEISSPGYNCRQFADIQEYYESKMDQKIIQ